MAFDVRTLRTALRRDMAARATAPFSSTPLWATLSHEGRQHLGRLVDWVAASRPDIYTVFADEDDIVVALSDAAERLDCIEWTLDDLLEGAVSEAIGTWVISVPLVGVAAPATVRALGEGLVLALASTWRNDNVDSSDVRRDVAHFAGPQPRLDRALYMTPTISSSTPAVPPR